MNKKRLLKNTKDYHEDLIQSLQDSTECAAYLQVAIEEYQQDGNAKPLLLALRNIAEAKGGMANLAKKTHLNRQSLYKTLSLSGNPTIDTFGIILNGLGFHLSIESNQPKTKSRAGNKARKAA